MAGAIQLTEVDFDQIRSNLIDYLKSTNQFTDYDFEGSNLSIILNLIAYQAQLNAYNTNMVANESFLASASVRSNVVANARMIGYTPSSSTSASTSIDCSFQLEESNYPSGFPRFCQMLPGLAFMAKGTNGSIMFNLVTTQTAAVSTDGIATFFDLPIYEGTYLTAKYTVDDSLYNQKFVIANEFIDRNTIRVLVQEDANQEIQAEYSPARYYTSVKDTDRVYWTEEVEDGHTELTFGDGLFGRKLQNGAVITVQYIISGGTIGNGIKTSDTFNFSGRVIDSYGGPVTMKPTISRFDPTQGGSGREDIASIKFRAPRAFAAQNRAVSSDDYESLIKQVYPAIDDVFVYGGEELTPPQFGRVFAVVKPSSAESLSSFAKDYITEQLKKYRVTSLDFQIIDPEVIYVEAVTNVYYDNRVTDKTASAITAEVKRSLTDYANSPNVSKFGSAAKFSQIVSIIDDSDSAITRNNTELRMRRDAVMAINTAASCEVCFENEIAKPEIDGRSAVYSSGFQKLNINGVNDGNTYYFDDDGKGNLVLFYFNSENVRVNVDLKFGTVDYVRGEVKFGYVTAVTVVNTEVANNILEIRAYPQQQDVLSQRSVSVNFDVRGSDIVSLIDNNVSKAKS
jgi:hypothetical protein